MIPVALHLLACPVCLHRPHHPGDCESLIAPATLCDCQEPRVPESELRYAVTMRAMVDRPEQARDLVKLWGASAFPASAGLALPSVSLSVDEYVPEPADEGVLQLPAALRLPPEAEDRLAEQGIRVEYLDLPAASDGHVDTHEP